MPDDTVLDDFEAGRIPGSAFPHERHVGVAWGLSRRYSHEEAFVRLAAGIKDIVVAQAEGLDAHPELLDRSLLARYYSRERLEAGRREWLEPDLEPLVLATATGRSLG